DFEPNSPAHLFVRDSSVINNGGAAILVKPQPGGSAKASVERTGMLHSQAGLRAEDNSIVSVVDSVASNNVNNGFLSISTAANVEISIERCEASNNGTNGVATLGGNAVLRVSNTLITGNA